MDSVLSCVSKLLDSHLVSFILDRFYVQCTVQQWTTFPIVAFISSNLIQISVCALFHFYIDQMSTKLYRHHKSSNYCQRISVTMKLLFVCFILFVTLSIERLDAWSFGGGGGSTENNENSKKVSNQMKSHYKVSRSSNFNHLQIEGIIKLC